MLEPHQLGQEGERLAADYLVTKGYRIVSAITATTATKSILLPCITRHSASLK